MGQERFQRKRSGICKISTLHIYVIRSRHGISHGSHTQRIQDSEKLSSYLKLKGVDQTWWENVKAGTQNPWAKLEANDINNQMTQSRSEYAYTT